MDNQNPFYHDRMAAELLERILLENRPQHKRDLVHKMRRHRQEADRLRMVIARKSGEPPEAGTAVVR